MTEAETKLDAALEAWLSEYALANGLNAMEWRNAEKIIFAVVRAKLDKIMFGIPEPEIDPTAVVDMTMPCFRRELELALKVRR